MDSLPSDRMALFPMEPIQPYSDMEETFFPQYMSFDASAPVSTSAPLSHPPITGLLSPTYFQPFYMSVPQPPLGGHESFSEMMHSFPSPANSLIEPEKSPILSPHTVLSHSPGSTSSPASFEPTPNTSSSSVLTLLPQNDYPPHPPSPPPQPLNPLEYPHSKKLSTRKQQRTDKLPYATNLVNLHLTSPTPTTPPPRKRKPSPAQPRKPSTQSASYQCDFPNCDKTFTRPYNLKSHRRTHTAERPFRCPMCPKSFARQHDRNRHAKLHLGLKPYQCKFCNKSFARQDALNRHQRTTGANPTTCSKAPGCRKRRKMAA